MRINVYAEELTTEVRSVIKTVTDEEFGTRSFYGIRMFLKSPEELHSSPTDDDRSAITFWVPWTRKGGHDFELPACLFANLSAMVVQARDQERGEALS